MFSGDLEEIDKSGSSQKEKKKQKSGKVSSWEQCVRSLQLSSRNFCLGYVKSDVYAFFFWYLIIDILVIALSIIPNEYCKKIFNK